MHTLKECELLGAHPVSEKIQKSFCVVVHDFLILGVCHVRVGVSELVGIWREKAQLTSNLPQQSLGPVTPPDVTHSERGGCGQEKQWEGVIVEQRVL